MYKKRGRPTVPFVQRYCLCCGKPIPKRVSLMFYYVVEYCSNTCKIEHSKIEKSCEHCNTKFKVLPRDSHKTKCPTCQKHILKGAKACSHCNKLMFYHSPLVFGRKEYCCVQCMLEEMGSNIRYCSECRYPLTCTNGSLDYYHKRTKHKNCEVFKIRLNNMKLYNMENK